MSSGTLFYLMGPSGAGKDSVIKYARERLAGDDRVLFAHRYITRPAQHGAESHQPLTCAEFQTRRRLGLFLMDWESHGYRYGIGCEVEDWLGRGLSVVVNGSRAYLEQARERVERLRPVLLQVSPARLAERLHRRGRESEAQIEARLVRGHRHALFEANGLCVLDNDGPLQRAGEALVTLVLSASRDAPAPSARDRSSSSLAGASHYS